MKTSIKQIGLKLIVIILTVACSSKPITSELQVIDVTPTQIIVQSQLEQIVEHYSFILNETETAQAQEFKDTKKKYSNNENTVNRLKYALLLATPKSAFQNRNMAIKLLNDWPQQEKAESNLYNFRNLLLKFLTEQQHTHNTINNLSKQLKTERERVAKLQKLVRDIKDMEKNLFRRNLN